MRNTQTCLLRESTIGGPISGVFLPHVLKSVPFCGILEQIHSDDREGADMKMGKQMLIGLLTVSLLLGALPLAGSAAVPQFKDVKVSDWYADAVEYVVENGLMSGTSADMFSPESVASRGMLVSILHRMEGSPPASGSAFSDVDKSKYYAPAVAWAGANGIASGYADGRFLPESPVTREQLAVILYHYTQHQGRSTSTTGSLAGFTDASDVSDYAVDAMRWAVGKGLITGTGNDRLTPQGTATRAQLALILQRYHSDSAGSPAPKGATLVAKPITVSTQNAVRVAKSSTAIQDPAMYCGDAISEDTMTISGNYNVYRFSGAAEDKAVLESYVNTLCNGRYNFKLAKAFNQVNSASTQFSWGLDYTGTGNVTETMDVTYTDVYCNVCVFGTVSQDRLQASVWIPQEMDITDLGLRYGVQSQTSTLAGPSASAGLYQLSDGSFQTTDGRLTAAVGKAAVRRDSVNYNTTAALYRDTRLGREELSLGTYAQNETLFFCAEADQAMSGTLYTLDDLAREEGWLNQPVSPLKSAEDFSNYTWTQFFGAAHDNDFITPLTGVYNEFNELTVRVMYYRPNQVAVYYIYAEFSSAPYEVEALCAVDLSAKTPAATPSPSPTPTPSPTPGVQH